MFEAYEDLRNTFFYVYQTIFIVLLSPLGFNHNLRKSDLQTFGAENHIEESRSYPAFLPIIDKTLRFHDNIRFFLRLWD